MNANLTAKHAELVAAAEANGFTVTPDETADRIIFRADKSNDEFTYGLTVTIFSKGTSVIKGHAVTTSGRTIHIKNFNAALNYLKAYWN